MQSSDRGRDAFSALLCCVALVACLAAANPFVDSAFNDDWSYTHVAMRLAETGRFLYNGWGSPTIVFQSVWAALLIHLFGFSFNIVRMATLPFSLGVVALTYLLGKQAGLRQKYALLAGLTMAVCPLLVPLAATFMTDTYACFFGLLCLYAAVASAHAVTPKGAVVWLWVLVVAGICGGSDRQTVWVAPMLLIPCLAFFWRAHRQFLVQSAAAYALCLAALAIVVLQFSQRYAPTEISRSAWLRLIYANGAEATHFLVSLLLAVALMSLPALLCLQPLWRRLGTRTLLGVSLLCLLSFDYLRSGFGLYLGIAPFLGNIVTPEGVLSMQTGMGTRPQLLHLAERYPLTWLVLFALGVWIAFLKRGMVRLVLPKRIAILFSMFAVPYLLLLVPGAMLALAFDRYELPLIPLFLICTLLSIQEVTDRIPLPAWICLAAYALFSIVTTHDYARLSQARVQAAMEAQRLGIAPLHVSTGLERDAWLQLQTTGHVMPVMYSDKRPSDYNHFWFWFYGTSLRPEYVGLSGPRKTVPAKALVTVPYTSWAPPFHQAVYVLKREDIQKPVE